MEIEIADKATKTYFQDLKVGDCFMLPNEDNYIFLRVKEYGEGLDTINTIDLHDFDHYCFLVGQEVVKADAKLTIYK